MENWYEQLITNSMHLNIEWSHLDYINHHPASWWFKILIKKITSQEPWHDRSVIPIFVGLHNHFQSPEWMLCPLGMFRVMIIAYSYPFLARLLLNHLPLGYTLKNLVIKTLTIISANLQNSENRKDFIRKYNLYNLWHNLYDTTFMTQPLWHNLYDTTFMTQPL